MKISDLTWRMYRVPFRKPFVTAHGPLNERTGVLVSVRTDAGYIGHGEIAPLPSQSGASLEEAWRALPGVARALCGCELDALSNGDGKYIYSDEIARSATGRAHSRGRPYYGRGLVGRARWSLHGWISDSGEVCDLALPSALLCGLETAFLDVIGQARGQSVAALLAHVFPSAEDCEMGASRASVPVNTVIGGTTLAETVAQARTAVNTGFGCLKLKITGTSEEDVARVTEVRAAIGPGPCLRLDANESWSFEQACAVLPRLAPYDIEYIEQPLPAADLAGMARLHCMSPIPLAADEALTGLASARSVLEAEAADVLILKPQLAGGLLACREIIQLASEHDVACVITSTLDAGIGVAAALHLAASSSAIPLPCGLATLDLLEDDLLQDELAIERGCMAVPHGPGLGVALDEDALKWYTFEHEYD